MYFLNSNLTSDDSCPCWVGVYSTKCTVRVYISKSCDWNKSPGLSVQIRIWARRKAISEGHGEYALNLTGPILSFFEVYYNATYPLSKSGKILN